MNGATSVISGAAPGLVTGCVSRCRASAPATPATARAPPVPITSARRGTPVRKRLFPMKLPRLVDMTKVMRAGTGPSGPFSDPRYERNQNVELVLAPWRRTTVPASCTRVCQVWQDVVPRFGSAVDQLAEPEHHDRSQSLDRSHHSRKDRLPARKIGAFTDAKVLSSSGGTRNRCLGWICTRD